MAFSVWPVKRHFVEIHLIPGTESFSRTDWWLKYSNTEKYPAFCGTVTFIAVFQEPPLVSFIPIQLNLLHTFTPYFTDNSCSVILPSTLTNWPCKTQACAASLNDISVVSTRPIIIKIIICINWLLKTRHSCDKLSAFVPCSCLTAPKPTSLPVPSTPWHFLCQSCYFFHGTAAPSGPGLSHCWGLAMTAI